MKFLEKLNKYKTTNKCSNEEIAEKLGREVEYIDNIFEGKTKLTKCEEKNILEKLEINFKFTSKKVLGLMDLLFRLCSMVMSLTTLLLCINTDITAKTLVTLLSIGAVCSSLTMLPKIER